MRKMFGIILMLVMVFALSACGNNDENNELMQIKIDEAQGLVNEIGDLYKENGLLEGDHALLMQPVADDLNENMKSLKTSHQEIIEGGGYDEDDLNSIGGAVDDLIAEYKNEIVEQLALGVAIVQEEEIEILIEKFNEIVLVVNQSSEMALEKGWYMDDAFNAELDSILALLEMVSEDFDNEEIIVGEYKNELTTSLDELLPFWENLLAQVSEPYSSK